MSQAPPRIDTPDLGEPLSMNMDMDIPDPAANTSVGPIERDEPISVALDDNKPSLSSPLRNSTLASDIDPTSQASPVTATTTASGSAQSEQTSVSSQQATEGDAGGSVEGVLSAITGAAVAAPAAAVEYLTGNSTNTAQQQSSSPEQATSQLANSTSSTAQNLASTATNLAQQAVNSLPQGVSAYLPESLKSTGSNEAVPFSSSAGNHQPTEPISTIGKGSSDITKPHTTGNFEASGSLQSTQNPAIVEAQSDLAVKAEAGDL